MMVFGIDQATEDAIQAQKGLVHCKFSTLTVRDKSAEESPATEKALLATVAEGTKQKETKQGSAPKPTSSSDVLVLEGNSASSMDSMDTSSISKGKLKLFGLSQETASSQGG